MRSRLGRLRGRSIVQANLGVNRDLDNLAAVVENTSHYYNQVSSSARLRQSRFWRGTRTIRALLQFSHSISLQEGAGWIIAGN